MNQQSLHGIAGCWVVCFGVHHNLDGLLEVGMLVKVGVADAVSVAEHRDGLGPLLDGLHQLVAPTGDDQVYVAVQLGGKSIIRIRSKNLP